MVLLPAGMGVGLLPVEEGGVEVCSVLLAGWMGFGSLSVAGG